MERLLNEKEVAELLGWSLANLQRRRWLRMEPKFVKMGRFVRYREADIVDFLDRNTVEPREACRVHDNGEEAGC